MAGVAAHRVAWRQAATTARVTDSIRLGALVVGLMAITSVPYVYGYMVAGADRQFMGIVLNVPDTAQYFSWARESEHAVFIQNKLTPEPGAAVYFNLFWWIIGQIAVRAPLGIAETTQLVRPLAGAAYLISMYWLVKLVVRDWRERWTAFLVAAVGGGLGWLLVLGKQVSGTLSAPLDLYVTEPNAFLTVMAFPLQAMAGALLVLTLGLGALAFERRSPWLAALGGVLGLILGVQHGYDLLIVYAVIGMLGLVLAVRDGGWLRVIGLGALVCGPSAPAALYLAYLTHESPIWRGVLAQYGNAGVYTPSPPHLLILMGLPLLVVLSGVPLLVLGRREVAVWLHTAAPRELLIWTWLLVGMALIYIPTDFQIKMLACLQVPVALVAVHVLRSWLARLHLRWTNAAAWLFVLAVLPVNVYLLAWRFVDLNRVSYPYFLTRDEIGTLHWLEANSNASDVVLSSLTIGQYVPAVSGNTAFLAHWAQTLDFYAKQRFVEQYFTPELTEHDRSALLERFDVGYVIYGSQERALGTYQPVESASLQTVYSTPSVTLYRVRSASSSEYADAS